MASLAGDVAAHADEVQPTAQALATPTVAAGAQPTQVLPIEPTVENVPTATAILVPTIQVLPTETFRVIEITTRVATYAPTFLPTAVPTAELPQPTIEPDPLATVTTDTGFPPALTNETTATPVDDIATATIDGLTPFPFSTDTVISIVTSTVTETITPTIILSPAGTPGWLPPGPECNLLQSETAVKLDVPYIHQVLDIGVGDGNWACGPTSIAMILAYYGKLDPWQEYISREAANYTATPTSITRSTSIAAASAITSTPTATRRTSTSTPTMRSARTVHPVQSITAKATATMVKRTGLGFAPYVTNTYSNNGYTYNSTALDPRGAPVAGLYGTICPTGFADWSLMRSVLEQHGLSSRQISATWDGVVDALKRGHPVVIGADLTPVGHILVAVGYTKNGQLIVNDPYGNRFAPGYGGTRGEGLFYPWDCSMVRNALEVIGEYPPPPRPAQAGAAPDKPGLAPLPASYGGRTYDRAENREPSVPLRASAPLVSTPSTANSNSVSTAKLTTKPTAELAVIVPGVAIASAANDGKPDRGEPNTFGWGLFSMLSVAVAVVGVRGFGKTRRAFVKADTAAPPTATSGDTSIPAAIEPLVTAPLFIEAKKDPYPHMMSEVDHPAPTSPGGLQIILRRTLPLVLPLLFLGMRLYQASKGQEAARTRITDETKQLMIRNL